MNLQQLETFRWVAMLGSFTQAAHKLCTSQSTVSMRISELEQELGVKLLSRSSRRVGLTRKGAELLRHVTIIDSQVARIRSDVASSETISGTVKLGVAELIALTWLPDLVFELNRTYANISVELEVGLSGHLQQKLLAGEVDVGLLPGNGDFDPELEAVALGSVTFGFMAGGKTERPALPLQPSAIADHPLISLRPRSFLSDLHDRWFRQAGVAPTRQIYSNSMAVSAGLVRSGLGVSLLPVDFYEADVLAARMVTLAVEPALPPVRFYALHSHVNESPPVRTVIEVAARLSAFA